MSRETYLAVAEVVQAAAHKTGFVGPVEFTICRHSDYDWCGVDDDYAEVTEEEFASV